VPVATRDTVKLSTRRSRLDPGRAGAFDHLQRHHLAGSAAPARAITVGPTLQSAGISNNLDLSCKRAASVVVYLVSKGVKPSLLSAQCFGETHPVAPNDTADGKAKNRRVDITLTGDGT
jgi:hypothetical protein